MHGIVFFFTREQKFYFPLETIVAKGEESIFTFAFYLLQSIKEEERKKNKINDAANNPTSQDELTIYLRQPYGDSQLGGARRFSSKLKKGADEEKMIDKIEIDSDNIETPPATRKLFSPPREVKPVEKEPCKRERCNGSFQTRDFKNTAGKSVNNNADFGTGKANIVAFQRIFPHPNPRRLSLSIFIVSGNFDRYSSARRTRRYKKNQENGAEKESKVVDTDSFGEKPAERPHTLPLPEEEGRGKCCQTSPVWQEKSKRQDTSNLFDIDTALAEIARSGEDLQRLSRPFTNRNSRLPVSQPSAVIAVTNTVLSPVMQESRPREPSLTVHAERAVTSRERQRSMIDPSQVKEAISLTSNPPSQVNEDQNISISSRSRHQPAEDEIDLAIKSNGCQENESSNENIHRVKRSESTPLRNQNKITRDAPQSNHDGSVFHPTYASSPHPNVPNATSHHSFSSLPPTGKVRDQEMNDEGFEETQSLVSETLSQETSSGNYETDTHDSTRCSPAELRYGGADPNNPSMIRTTIDVKSLVDHDSANPIGNPLKPTKTSAAPSTIKANSIKHTVEKSSFLPKRANSLKRDIGKTEAMQRNSSSKFEFQSTNNNNNNNNHQARNEVERSGSRSSLRSSRSSLNSATSVNTVRNLVPNHTPLRTYTTAICALTNDLRKSPSHNPLPLKSNEKRRTNPRSTTITRIPASRSSSSGSSVGPTARTVRKSLGVSNSISLEDFIPSPF